RPARRALGALRGYDGDVLRSFFTHALGPPGPGCTQPRDQLGLALLPAWTRAERRAVSDPASLPADVIGFVPRQLDLSAERRRQGLRDSASLGAEAGLHPGGPRGGHSPAPATRPHRA